jgi:hypothetical protein
MSLSNGKQLLTSIFNKVQYLISLDIAHKIIVQEKLAVRILFTIRTLMITIDLSISFGANSL